MFKNLFWKVVNLLYLRDGSIRKIHWGPYRGLTYRVNDSLLNRRSIFYKYLEPEVSKVMKRIVREDMTIFCCGAHVGIHALYLTRLASKGRVYAFEPDPHNYKVLVENVSLNGFGNIFCINKALGDTTGKVKFRIDKKSGRGMGRLFDSIAHDLKFKDNDYIEVDVDTVDNFIQNTYSPDFLLIDVEGAENLVLKGAKNLLRTESPGLIIELHGKYMDRKHSKELLSTYDYSIEDIDVNHIFCQKNEQ